MHIDSTKHPLLGGLDAAAISAWLRDARVELLEPGEALFHEGDSGEDFFLVESGQLEVLRARDGHVLATLGEGDEVGAMALIDGRPRSATVRAATSARVLRVPGRVLTSDDAGGDERSRSVVLRNLLVTHAARLRHGNEKQLELLERQLEESRTRNLLGRFTTHAIALMCLYGLSLRLGMQIAEETGDSAPFSVACLAVFVASLFWMTKRSGEPMSTYGMTTMNAGRAISRALWTTSALSLALTGLKALAIRTVPALAGAPLFEMKLLTPGAPLGGALWLVLYVLFVPAQEFVARGALQGSMRRFFTGRRVGLKANVLANLMFAGSHVHVSAEFALLVIPPGLFWGYLMERDGTLIGPIVSHVLLGVWVVFVLGVPGLG